MKRLIFLMLVLVFSVSLFSQQTESIKTDSTATDSLVVAAVEQSEAKPLTKREKICKQVADGLIETYEKWDYTRDLNILRPRIKDAVMDFFKKFPNFDVKVLVATNAQERSALVAYTILKNSLFEEISRFVSNKNFYWGYMDSDLAERLKSLAKVLGDDIRSRKEEIVQTHLDQVKTLFDQKEALVKELDELRASGAEKEVIEKKRLEMIAARDKWIYVKRFPFETLAKKEAGDLNRIVDTYLTPQVKRLNITNFDISDEMIAVIRTQDSTKIDELLVKQIRNKFYNGLIGKFGMFLKYDPIPSFRDYRINVLIGVFMFMALFWYVFLKVKKHKEEMYIRRIPGLDAIDDAVGRATEMGKPIIYDSGIGSYTTIDTIASFLILRNVAKKVAEFKAEIYFPTCDPIVMQIGEEMISSGFLDAGYPEDHKKENIFFLAADQFAFAAGLSGLTARKKPATCIHFGYYAAESLLIAEAGFTAGAIQVAGTTAVSQLPFFITACDYTLIGEELYAAAAYLSREPQILTNLKLSDYGKMVIGIIFIIGTLMLSMNSDWTFLQDLFFTK